METDCSAVPIAAAELGARPRHVRSGCGLRDTTCQERGDRRGENLG
jgi:hypothetical protein